MRYRRMTGKGPKEGWVQLVRPSGIKPLLVKTELRPPAQKAISKVRSKKTTNSNNLKKAQ